MYKSVYIYMHTHSRIYTYIHTHTYSLINNPTFRWLCQEIEKQIYNKDVHLMGKNWKQPSYQKKLV